MRRPGIIASIVLCAVACGRGRVTPPAPDAGSRRTTTAGDVVGFVGRYGSFAWMGIAVSGRYLVFDTPAGGGVRVANDTPSRDAVLAVVEHDPRLRAPRDRCLVYHELVAWSGVLSRAAFDEKCAGLPFDGYPWS